ncbi:GTP1/OBG sub domain protein [Candidatus Saccharibacteria bacterium]|nr:MAG: GTP1/OBG sub domain protein [Candidatus Saccharibacteria bacterium]
MFVDTATVTVQAGKGGDGVVSFRHEIYVDKGGPDGGDGGRGGDVVFEAADDVNTLLDFRYKPELRAEKGANGAKRNRRGRSGKDLIVKVPVGTIVTRDDEVIADFVKAGQRVVVAHGGDGGFGNAHFKSSTRQAPKIAELGEPGEEFCAQLELKLLADVGLVGFPNAGKSTFLSVVSNARPEIANYAFTTLTPNLGVAEVDGNSMLIADIPGLIEGASTGKGLGDAFLRHIERTGVLLHLIDAYSDDVAASYRTIRRELTAYSDDLAERPEVIALTKVEGLDEDIIGMQRRALQAEAGEDASIYAISSQAHQGVIDVLRELRRRIVEQATQRADSEADNDSDADSLTITLDPRERADQWRVEHLADGSYRVSGAKIEKFARRTNFEQFQAVNRLRDIMKKLGITHELIRAGAEGDSVIHIGESTFTLIEQ